MLPQCKNNHLYQLDQLVFRQNQRPKLIHMLIFNQLSSFFYLITQEINDKNNNIYAHMSILVELVFHLLTYINIYVTKSVI